MTLRSIINAILGPKPPTDPNMPTKAELAKIIDEYHDNETQTPRDAWMNAVRGPNPRRHIE